VNACDPGGSEHCITCSDEGVPMRVMSVGLDGALCVDEEGSQHEGIAVELVGPVAPGDRVLVHAGVAIA
jgi:hydrogenase expression/formation protein HypC